MVPTATTWAAPEPEPAPHERVTPPTLRPGGVTAPHLARMLRPVPTFLARVVRHDEITGQRITLELIKDTDAVELVAGDEFVTVDLKVDPFAGQPQD